MNTVKLQAAAINLKFLHLLIKAILRDVECGVNLPDTPIAENLGEQFGEDTLFNIYKELSVEERELFDSTLTETSRMLIARMMQLEELSLADLDRIAAEIGLE